MSLNSDELKQFESQGDQFTTFLGKHQFLHSFIDGNQSESLPKEEEIIELEQENLEKREQFLITTNDLKNEISEYNDMRSKYIHIAKRVEEIIELESSTPRTANGSSRRVLMDEIIETERLINKLKKDQTEVDTLVQKRITRNAELKQDIQDKTKDDNINDENIENVRDNNTNSNDNSSSTKKVKGKASAQKQKSGGSSSSSSSSKGGRRSSITNELKPKTDKKTTKTPVKTVTDRINEMESEKVRLQMVLEGLQKFTGVKIVEAKSIQDENNNDHMLISLELGSDCAADLILDNTMSVADLKIKKSRIEIDTAKVLCDACVLPTPQDIRQVVFVLGAMQNAPSTLTDHLNSLKKQVLVHRLGPWLVQVTLSCGVSARFAVHQCYPEVPTGVHVESLEAVGGFSQQELDEAVRDANAVCFTTIHEAVSFLSDHLA